MYHSNLKEVKRFLENDIPYDRVALIDADIVAFQFAVLNCDTIDWGDTGTTQIADSKRALAEAKRFVVWLGEQCGGYIVLCFTGKSNFRKTEFPDYKGQRKKTETPAILNELKDLLSEEFYSVRHDMVEADDVLGILQTSLNMKSMIATLDKDLDQIEGSHYNWRKELTYTVTSIDGLKFLWKQVLTGDPTDNYGGCYRVGAKGADALLEGLGAGASENLPVIYRAYLDRESKRTDKSTFPTHDRAYLLSQIRCAMMLTEYEWDFDNNVPDLFDYCDDMVERLDEIDKEFEDEEEKKNSN